MRRVCSTSFWRLGFAAVLALAAVVASVPAQADDPNDFVIVDCRLAPKVRKLGTQAVYQTAGQLLKLPAKVCSLRGGEFTIDDPGSYANSIRRWMKAAADGNPEAETNVGILYAHSDPADFAAAASWYQKAADQGYAPAETALGELYETGQGVPKDQVKALNLYRKASGIQGKDLELIEPATDAPPPKQQTGMVQPTPTQAANLAPPSIEIVYPLATAAGDQTKLRVRAASSSDTMVGRVVSQAGIDHATADGQPLKIDGEGYFILPLTSASKKSSFRLAASDILGRNTSLDVSLAQGQDAARDPAATAGATSFGNYYALIIGNSRFQHWDEIDNAQTDAQSVDQVLRTRYGFKTTLMINANRRAMLQAFNTLRENMTPSDNLLIYYAGHGHLNPNVDRGYWIPIDADVDSDAEWILSDQITDYLKLMPSKHVMIIADSCYSGVLTRTSVQRPKPAIDLMSRSEAIKALAGHTVRTVMTSGGVQPVLDAGSGGHSVFAVALLKILSENTDLLEANRLFDALSPEVVQNSERYHYKQVPTYRALTSAGHEGGDFLFVPVNAGG